MKTKLKPLMAALAVAVLFSNNIAYSSETASTLKNSKVLNQDDPLNISNNRPQNAKEVLQRIMSSASKELDMNSVLTNVLDGTLDSAPDSLSTISVEMMDKALNSENAIDKLNESGEFFETLAETTRKAVSLVNASRDLVKSKDELNASLMSRSELEQSFEKYNAEIDTLYDNLQYFSQKVSEQDMALKSMAARLNDLKSQQTANVGLSAEDIEALIYLQQSAGAPAEKEEPSANGIPFTTLATTVIDAPDGKRGRARVLINGAMKPIEVEQGFTTGGYLLTGINESGIEVTRKKDGERFFLANKGGY